MRLRNFFLFDKDPAQVTKLEQLRDGLLPLPNGRRQIKVTQGDFNSAVAAFLAEGKIPIEPTFCLLDQRTFECRWATVEAIASYKPTGTKIELFYFLPIAWLDRAFCATSKEETLESIAAWWGRDDWEVLRHMKNRDRSSLFAQRFTDLGYADVKPWPIYSDIGSSRVMYYMIHATDHPDAPLLMRRAYERVGLPTPPDQLKIEFEPADLTPPDPPTPELPEDLFGLSEDDE